MAGIRRSAEVVAGRSDLGHEVRTSDLRTVTEAKVAYAFVKRATDIVGAATLLVLLSPVLLLTALGILLTSWGPIFFRRQRVGQDGRPFSVIKFRTMVVGAPSMVTEAQQRVSNIGHDRHHGPAFKSSHDPRVTRLGGLLRRTSIDELPQLLNILSGSMALVGPRPLVQLEVDALNPSQRAIRQTVRPGLTCIWQTSGRSRVSYEERIAMDLDYVRDRSIVLDIVLLLRTPYAVLRGDGAY